MSKLLIVLKREYVSKIRNKSFIVMTFLSPLLLAALAAVVVWISSSSKNEMKTIVVVDAMAYTKGLFVDSDKREYKYMVASEDSVKNLLETGQYEAGLIVPVSTSIDSSYTHSKIIVQTSQGITFTREIERKLEDSLYQLNLQRQEIDLDKISEARVNISLVTTNLEGETSSDVGQVLQFVFGGAAGYLLFMFIIIYGNMIMRSVIEEKTGRIIEIIISSVKPTDLMMGKILGTSLVGLTQFLIWVVLGGLLLNIVPVFMGLSPVDMMQGGNEANEVIAQVQQNPSKIAELMAELQHFPLLNLTLAFLAFFLLGYLLYSALFAAIGAAVDNETDTQQFVTPIMLPLILAIYVGFVTIVDTPHSTAAIVFSHFPLTSPVVMLMRIPFGVPVWEQLVSLVILIFTLWSVTWLAAKVYRTGILMYGKKPSFKEVFKWIRR